MIGVKYTHIYPELLFTVPNGLQIFRSKFKPARSKEVLCIGGPLGALEHFVSNLGIKSNVKFLLHQMTYFFEYRPKFDYFPVNGKICNFVDEDTEEMTDEDELIQKMSHVSTVVLSFKYIPSKVS